MNKGDADTRGESSRAFSRDVVRRTGRGSDRVSPRRLLIMKQLANRLAGFVQGAMALVFLFAFFSASQAQEKVPLNDFVLTATGKNALEALKSENLFALGGTGYSGAASKGEMALDILLQERDGAKALYRLAVTSSGAGGLYALFGLRLLKSEAYLEAYHQFLQLPDQPERKGGLGKLGVGIVQIMEGCILSWQHRLEVAKEIESGKFDQEIDRKNRLKQQKEEYDRKVLDRISKERTTT